MKHSFDLWAYVFMPDHVHLIVHPRRSEYAMPKIVAGIKLPVARRAIDYLQQTNSPWLAKITRQRGKHTERLFWQYGGGYDRNITCGKSLLRMVEYLHLNPIRRGLVLRAPSGSGRVLQRLKEAIALFPSIPYLGSGWRMAESSALPLGHASQDPATPG